MSDLTEYQLKVLQMLPDEATRVYPESPAGRRLKGSKLRAAKVLVDKGYAVCTGWIPDSPGQWFLRTEAGEAFMHLVATEALKVTIDYLRSEGLQANVSKRDPLEILGGLNSSETEVGTIYEGAFFLSPRTHGYKAILTGPGNLESAWDLASVQLAAQQVVTELRARRDLPKSKAYHSPRVNTRDIDKFDLRE